MFRRRHVDRQQDRGKQPQANQTRHIDTEQPGGIGQVHPRRQHYNETDAREGIDDHRHVQQRQARLHGQACIAESPGQQ